MRSFTIILNDKESGNFAFEEGFSVAALDIVDAAIKANDVCMAVCDTIRDAKGGYPHINPNFIRVDSIADQGVLLGGDPTATIASWITEYVDDILERNKAGHDD